MAFFVGGQIMLAPWSCRCSAASTAADRSSGGTPVRARDADRRRRAVITGVAIASHLHKWHDSTLQVKLGLVVILSV